VVGQVWIVQALDDATPRLQARVVGLPRVDSNRFVLLIHRLLLRSGGCVSHSA
jgi:hypothetical protein